MKNNKKKEIFKLTIEIGDESSELIQRLEKIIEEDIVAQKLPKDLTIPENTAEND